MPGWDTYEELVKAEFAQSQEEGRNPVKLMELRKELKVAREPEQFKQLLERLSHVRQSPSFPFREPSDLETIRSLRGPKVSLPAASLSDDDLYDRTYGAWLGRCVGCALGKPVEGFMGPKGQLSSKERVKRYLLAVGPNEYPIRDYIPKSSPAEAETGKQGCPLSCRENISFMETDDDIRYTVLGLMVLRDKGRSFTSLDVMRTWLVCLPLRWVCTAETQAYRNFADRYEIHMHAVTDDTQVGWDFVATHQNPYREWIGAQIRADAFGYAAPGNPELAAEFAWRDARMSHVKNGIYGEMLVAAMIAAAFVSADPMEIVNAGLAQIPATSRLHADMLKTIEICRAANFQASAFEKVLEDIYAAFGHYHPVHTNNNAAIVVASLLLSAGDLEKAVTIAVMGGWDTDCNGATVGSIIGAMVGAKRLPAKWVEPLNDTLKSGIADYHPIAISECAKRTVEVAKSVMAG